MMQNLFSVFRLKQLRTRQLQQQQLIKRENLREQLHEENVRDRQRAVLQGRYGDYVFKTLGRPPPPPPPRHSHLPGQGSEHAPTEERTPLDFLADFEQAKETGESARGEHKGQEEESSRDVHERGRESLAEHRRDLEEQEQYSQDIFLQPGSNTAQQDTRDGESGSGGQSGGHHQGGDGRGQGGQAQAGGSAAKLHMQAMLADLEVGMSSDDPVVQADTLVAALGSIVWAAHGAGHPVQAMLLARIAAHLLRQNGNKPLTTVAEVREALLRAGLDVAGKPSDRFALLPLQLLNYSRPRTTSQLRLTTERLAGGPAWLLPRMPERP
ncbi:hypothetical protein [Paracidovorax cattleyae]|uniref:Type III secretion regulatory protein HpaA n=1 Tax=Paracidovorax cattleyae TaxID=80868 RepID=A0A1H0QDB5_9BURK|nr:hypothetical protein [Paracidovorax cattleyae]AVS73002.1 hypothetical protein C8240_02100 [Paracidovorax cattleyae]SDP14686.1 type III secretion regulatory protein HpaA [Paracidovorax cattleyae]